MLNLIYNCLEVVLNLPFRRLFEGFGTTSYDYRGDAFVEITRFLIAL